MEPRPKKGVFIGYGDGVKGHRIWSPSEGRVIISRNVVFNENSMFNPIMKSIVVVVGVLINRWSSKSLMMRVMIINTLFPNNHNLQYQVKRRLAWLGSVL